jgi:hypothetical protein
LATRAALARWVVMLAGVSVPVTVAGLYNGHPSAEQRKSKVPSLARRQTRLQPTPAGESVPAGA